MNIECHEYWEIFRNIQRSWLHSQFQILSLFSSEAFLSCSRPRILFRTLRRFAFNTQRGLQGSRKWIHMLWITIDVRIAYLILSRRHSVFLCKSLHLPFIMPYAFPWRREQVLIEVQLNSCNPNSYNSNNHVIRTNFPVPSNFPIMYGNSYNSNNHVIRTNFPVPSNFPIMYGNSYNSNNHVIRTNFPVPSNFPIMYGNSYNSNNHVIRTNFPVPSNFPIMYGNSYNSNNHVIRTDFPVPSNFPIMYGNSYNSNNHVIRTDFPVPSNFPIMYGNSYNSNNHVIRTNFSALWEFELHEFYCISPA